MAGIEIKSFRNEDNSISMVVLVPPRRNGEPNFGAIARINRELLLVNPGAFDPPDAPPEVEVEAPPLVALHEGDDTPEESLNFGKEHG